MIYIIIRCKTNGGHAFPELSPVMHSERQLTEWYARQLTKRARTDASFHTWELTAIPSNGIIDLSASCFSALPVTVEGDLRTLTGIPMHELDTINCQFIDKETQCKKSKTSAAS